MGRGSGSILSLLNKLSRRERKREGIRERRRGEKTNGKIEREREVVYVCVRVSERESIKTGNRTDCCRCYA